jgi:hypothetical protein
MTRLMLALLMVSSHTIATVLPLPTTVRDGETIFLECGRIYVGELDLSNRQGVTVTTRGDCGSAIITPAQPIPGWKNNPRDTRLWSARLDTAPIQFEVGGQFLALAHHPNVSGQWLQGKKLSALQLKAKLPEAAMEGATLVWRAADWLIQTRTITRYGNQILQLASGDDEGLGLLPETEFYVEGKRWMLDSPGEWIHADGWLHVWPLDGKSPENRAWVTQRARAINASGSQNVNIHHLKIFAATLGIDGSGSRNLAISDVDITNSGEEAILIGGSGARLRGIRINGTVQNGIRANDDARDVIIADSQIDGVGMLGMPRRSKGSIIFEAARGHTVQRNRITNTAYIGIRVFRQAIVTDNVVDRACLRLGDCGGIYTFARDRQPLDTLIDGNKITHLQGRMSHAIYLDDFANGVTVRGNQLMHNPSGMQLHNGFENLITQNIFSDNLHEHILFNETAPFASIRRNRIESNQFISRKETPSFRLWSHHGDKNVRNFADFENNTYVSTPSHFAEVEGHGLLSYKAWQATVADEPHARFSVPGMSPQLAGERQKK